MINRKHRRILLTTLSLLVLLGFRTEGTLLQSKGIVGNTFKITRHYKLHGYTKSDGGFSKIEYHFESSLDEIYTEELLAVNTQGRPSKVKRTYEKGHLAILESDEDGRLDPSNKDKSFVADYDGQTLTLAITDKPEKNEKNEDLTARLSGNDYFQNLLPSEAKEIDDKWKFKKENAKVLEPILAHFVHRGDFVGGSAKLKLIEIKTIEKSQIAVIALTLSYDINRTDGPLTRGTGGNLKGLMEFNITEGYISSVELEDNSGIIGGTWDWGGGIGKLAGKATAHISYKAEKIK